MTLRSFSIPTDVINLCGKIRIRKWMEDKQCKQSKRFSVMTKGSDYILSLDDKSKRRYIVKINDIKGYDPY